MSVVLKLNTTNAKRKHIKTQNTFKRLCHDTYTIARVYELLYAIWILQIRYKYKYSIVKYTSGMTPTPPGGGRRSTWIQYTHKTQCVLHNLQYKHASGMTPTPLLTQYPMCIIHCTIYNTNTLLGWHPHRPPGAHGHMANNHFRTSS